MLVCTRMANKADGKPAVCFHVDRNETHKLSIDPPRSKLTYFLEVLDLFTPIPVLSVAVHPRRPRQRVYPVAAAAKEAALPLSVDSFSLEKLSREFPWERGSSFHGGEPRRVNGDYLADQTTTIGFLVLFTRYYLRNRRTKVDAAGIDPILFITGVSYTYGFQRSEFSAMRDSYRRPR